MKYIIEIDCKLVTHTVDRNKELVRILRGIADKMELTNPPVVSEVSEIRDITKYVVGSERMIND